MDDLKFPQVLMCGGAAMRAHSLPRLDGEQQ